MKNRIVLIAIISVVSVAFELMNFLPWWSYLIPCFLLGVALPFRKWKTKPFMCGFISGLLTWGLAAFVFEFIYEGEVTQITAEIIGIHSIALNLFVGVVGGILCGLAVLSGAMLGESFTKQDLQSNSTTIE